METLNTDTVTIETTINAPIEKVWEAWTDPAVILHWFGSDPNGKGIHARMDLRPGGMFEVSFTDADGTQHTCYGVYVDVKPLSKLSFTWRWKSEPGIESFVMIELVAGDNVTHLFFQHSNVGTASQHNYLLGWQATFRKLEQLLGKK